MSADNRPDVGDAFPDIAMTRSDGENVSIADFKGQKAVVFFYPKASTPGCTTEAKDFSALLPEFAKAGVAVLGASKDSLKRQQNFIDKQELTVPIASDAEEDGLTDALGVWTEKKNYGRTYMGIERSTFLIDADGKIAQVWRKVRVKDHAAKVLEAAKAL
ncbi:thioredoxin-dependent thiol peroxidase [Croceicoccus naphthovorans]|uniref:thioredoxin-dependent peroxiredoxin n=1 Tax=Croceicoccus naphthovorans TaxID=1348774 RepID=A0A0G3XB59_9SPHN|nr:thioredoxin-dependent thiol peroxidase [Croceicoccus naphthovorans]AKM08780.1 alkyl hydroperoxide reductase [Croceicoccus naphthovorans]MBB3992120.1 peroxiredoxin Q/BCP [Croceicoccus naphthovorans]